MDTYHAGGLDIQAVIDSFPYYVMIIDEEHTVVAANHAVHRDLGVEGNALIGMYCPKGVHGMDTPFPGCPLELAVHKDEDIERTFWDESKGVWLKTGVYPTGFCCSEGRRLFMHTAQVVSDPAPA